MPILHHAQDILEQDRPAFVIGNEVQLFVGSNYASTERDYIGAGGTVIDRWGFEVGDLTRIEVDRGLDRGQVSVPDGGDVFETGKVLEQGLDLLIRDTQHLLRPKEVRLFRFGDLAIGVGEGQSAFEHGNRIGADRGNRLSVGNALRLAELLEGKLLLI